MSTQAVDFCLQLLCFILRLPAIAPVHFFSSIFCCHAGSDSSPHQVDGEEAMLDDDGCDQEQENVLSEEEEEKECFENSDVSPNHFSLNGSPQPDSTTSGSQCATPQRTEQSDDAGYGRLADDGAAIYITDSSCSLSCASLVPSGKLPLLLDEAVVQRSFGDPAPMTAGEVTVDKSLGRSIALGIDSVRDAMDTAMFSTCSKEDEPDGQPISEWPISSNHSKVGVHCCCASYCRWFSVSTTFAYCST